MTYTSRFKTRHDTRRVDTRFFFVMKKETERQRDKEI